MKKLIIIVHLIGTFLYAQVPAKIVYDPTAATNMGKQIQNAGQQLKQLDKTVQYLEKAENTLSKVSGYVRDMEELKDIVSLQKKSIDYAQKLRNNIGKVQSAKLKNRYLKDTAEDLKRLNTSVVFINKLLTNNFFKMSDKDRMEMIKAEREKVFNRFLNIKVRLSEL